MRGLSAAKSGGQPTIDDSRFTLSADLERVATLLARVTEGEPIALGGSLQVVADAKQDGDAIAMTTEITPRSLRVQDIGIAGDPLKGSFRMLPGADQLAMSGGLETPRLAVTLADGRVVEQRAVRIDVDMTHAAATERMQLNNLGYRSQTATLTVSGAMTGSDPMTANGDFKVGVKAQIERLLADLGALAGLTGYRGQGAVDAQLDLAMRPEQMSFGGAITANGVDLTIPPAEPGGASTRLTEPNVRLDLASVLKQAEERMDLTRFELKSETMWGDMTGAFTGIAMAPSNGGAPPEMYVESMKGNFQYIPDRLGTLLAPHLPGKLIGATPEDLVIDFRGPLKKVDLFQMLSESNMSLGLGLGTFSTLLLDTTGRIDVEMKEGRVHMLGDLGANGGTLDLTLGLGVAKSSPQEARKNAEFAIKLSDVKAGAAIADVLGGLHPVFGLNSAGGAGDFLATLTGELDLRYNGPMSVEELVSGWRNLPTDLFYGKGLIRIDQPVIQGSPLLSTLFTQLDVPASDGLAIEPVNFEIDSSKLIYEGWKWAFGDVKTDFGGAVGLDGALDLAWNIPVTKKLINRYSFLEPLKGERIKIPLGGSVGAPKLSFTEAIQSLAGDAARKTLTDQIGGELGGLLGDENAEDPKALLSQANDLWSQGKKADAAKLYRRIEKKHKLSTTYLLNKDLIEKRGEYREKKDGEPSSDEATGAPANQDDSPPADAAAPKQGDDAAAEPAKDDKDDPKTEKSKKKDDDGKTDKEKYKEQHKGSKKGKGKKGKKKGKKGDGGLVIVDGVRIWPTGLAA